MRSRSNPLPGAESQLRELAVAEDIRADRLASRAHLAADRRIHETDGGEACRLRVAPVTAARTRTVAAPDVAELVKRRRQEVRDRETAVSVDCVDRDGARGGLAAAAVVRER